LLLTPTTSTALAQSMAAMPTPLALGPTAPAAGDAASPVLKADVSARETVHVREVGPAPGPEQSSAPAGSRRIFDVALVDLAGRSRSRRLVNDRTAPEGAGGSPDPLIAKVTRT